MNDNSPHPLEATGQLIAIALMVIGVVVVAGWHFHSLTIIRLDTSLPPMQYNTAMGLLVAGAGLLALFRDIQPLSLVAATLLLVLGVVTGLQYVTGTELGIDELVVPGIIDYLSPDPGRMAPNTALCFLLTALALYAASLRQLGAWVNVVATIMGGAILGLASVAFFGYLTHIIPAFSWGSGNAMAVHTALAFMLLGGGILGYTRSRDLTTAEIRRWLLGCCITVILTVSVCLQVALVQERQAGLRKILNDNTNMLNGEINRGLDELALAFERMGERWLTTGGTPETAWRADAFNYYENFHNFLALQWVTPATEVGWAVPETTSNETVGVALNRQSAISAALDQSREQGICYSQLVSYPFHGPVVLLVFPLEDTGGFDGWLVGILDRSLILDSIDPMLEELGLSAQLRQSDGTLISASNGPGVASSTLSPAPNNNEMVAVKSVDIAGQIWQLEITPTDAFYSLHASPLQTVLTYLAFLMFLPLIWLMYQLLKSRNQGQDIRRLHERIQTAFDTMLDGLIIIDGEGIIRDLNKSALRMFGYERRELLGVHASQLLPDHGRHRYQDYAQSFTTAEESTLVGKTRIYRAVHKSGGEFPIELNIKAGDRGRDLFFTAVIRDLSEQLAREDKLNQTDTLLRVAIHSANVGIAIVDLSGRFIEVNDSLSGWLGYNRSELIGVPFFEVIADHERESSRIQFQDLLAGQESNQRSERPFKRKDGKVVWGLSSRAPVRDKNGNINYVTAQVVDIEPEKQLRAQLEQRNQALEAINTELDQFAYVASHDLKEPLRTLRTFSDYLLKDVETGDHKRIQEDVSFIDNAAERMTQLIDDLLQLSRASNKFLDFQTVELEKCVYAARDQLLTLMEEKGAQLEIADTLPTVFGDPNQLTRVFLNLLNNAVKFHRPDVPPVVRIAWQPAERPGCVAVTVEDNGIGIPDNFLTDVFGAFKKLHSSTRYTGTGIGLAIVKKIIERHKGDIHVTSTMDEGSCFTLILPTDNPGTER